jgi:hypothetical protein
VYFSGAAHSSQNFAPARFSCAHEGQTAAALMSDGCYRPGRDPVNASRRQVVTLLAG